MRNHTADYPAKQQVLFETEAARSLLDKLLEDSRLYTQSKDYKDLLDFVARLRNFAPFNAMLLHLQKPGLSYAASARDWRDRFGRRPKEGHVGWSTLGGAICQSEGRQAGQDALEAALGQDPRQGTGLTVTTQHAWRLRRRLDARADSALAAFGHV